MPIAYSDAVARILEKLKQRNVLAIAGAYVVVAWVLIEAAELLFDAFDVPATAIRVVIVTLALGLPVIALLAWTGWLTFAWLQRLTGQPVSGAHLQAIPTATLDPRSIAVLPFADLSPGGDQRYFSHGLADEILTALTQIPALKVIGRTSSFSFQGTDLDLRAIGERLNVTTLLEGSVRAAGGRFRISANLVHARDGFSLWSKTFESEMSDIFAVQSDISLAVVKALKVRLLNEDRAPINRGTTHSPEAFIAYLKGRHIFTEATATHPRYGEALLLYEQAVELDPGYADAWVGIGEVWVLLQALHLKPPEEAWPKVREAASKALAIEPKLGEAHALLGRVQFSHEFDWAGAEASFSRALHLGPGSSEIMGVYAWASPTRARAAEGVRVARELVERDMLSVVVRRRFGFALMLAGEHREAISVLTRLLTDFPGAGTANIYIGAMYLAEGDREKAFAAFQKETQPYYSRVGQAVGHGALGRLQDAHRLMQELKDEYGDALSVPYAWIHVWCNEPDAAFECLERALELKDYLLAWLQVDPLLAPLRTDPRFTDLAARLGFTL